MTGVYRSLPPCLTPLFEFSPKLGRYELTDEQYNRLQPLLSGKPLGPGRNADDNRRFLNAVLWIARTAAPWEDLPERFGKHDTVYQRSGRWAKKGRWQAIFEALQEPDLDWVMLDSSVVRAHQHAAGRKKGIQTQKHSDGAEEASPRKSTSPATRWATR